MRTRNSRILREFSGALLRQARENANMRREDLAYHAQVSLASIAQYELGGSNPSANNLARLADALGISIDDLFM